METRRRCVALHEAGGALPTYGECMVRRSYAVVWQNGAGVDSGRLEPGFEGLLLVGRDHVQWVAFGDLVGVAIARGPNERIRGLPVLVLRRRDDGDIRVASLEGAAALHELLEHIAQFGLTVTA